MQPKLKPNATIASHCCLVNAVMRGRATTSNTRAAKASRSVVTPAAPRCGNNCAASAAPNCNEVHEPMTSSTAERGTPECGADCAARPKRADDLVVRDVLATATPFDTYGGDSHF